MRLPAVTCLLLLLVTSHFGTAQTPHFRDAAAQAGLTVAHHSSADKRYVIESMSGGVGMIDCDGDGKLDLLTVNGSSVDRYRKGGDLLVTLYHQDSDLKFSDISEKAGLTVKGWGMGVAVADFDNDGILDIYVTGYGHNALYKGLGNCRFQDVTTKAGVGADGFSAGAAWADYDGDGFVDLFVSRYVKVDIDHLPEIGSDEKFCRFKGLLVQCGPRGMPGHTDLLFHNNGDGTFTEVAKKAGVDNPSHYYGMAAIWGDYDNDGWPDLYVADDAGPNYLYRNKHDGTFEDVGLMSGVALSADGQELGSMGVDWGDFDHDGLLDLTVTNFADQPNNLYRNLGPQGFTDLGWPSKIGEVSYPYVGWGTGFVDFANVGWPDIFVVNGHVYPQVDVLKTGAGYRQPVHYYRNKRNRTFEEIGAQVGVADLPLQSRRGAAFGDVNNDGKIDVLILNVGQPPSLLINDAPNPNHRVLFKLVGTGKSNRAAIGTRITIKTATLTQFNEVRGGGSYLSQNDLRLHFGLAQDGVLDSVEIRWPDRQVETLRNLSADFIYTIVQGQGVTSKTALPAPDTTPQAMTVGNKKAGSPNSSGAAAH
jgi:hypothetical protein